LQNLQPVDAHVGKSRTGRFNVLKNDGYNLEHNFGHGKKTLSNVLVTFNLLAFAFHTAAYLGIIAWKAAVTACGPTTASSII